VNNMRNFTYSIGRTLSFLSGPFLVFCPLCHWAPVIATAGQSTFLIAYAKILGPLTVILLVISLFSFYYTYAKVHHNILPLILASLGSIGYAYINYLNPLGSTFFLFFGLLFLILASGIDFNLRFSSERILNNQCKI